MAGDKRIVNNTSRVKEMTWITNDREINAKTPRMDLPAISCGSNSSIEKGVARTVYYVYPNRVSSSPTWHA